MGASDNSEFSTSEEWQEFYFVRRVIKNFMHKWYIAVISCFIMICLSIGLANLFVPKYESKMIIFSKNSLNKGGGSTMSILSTIDAASPLGGGRQQSIHMLVKVIGSERLASRLIQSGDYMQVVFKDQWDPESRTWHEPRSVVSSLSRFLRSAAGMQPWYPPDATDLASYLTKSIRSDVDSSSGALNLVLTGVDPAFTQRMLQAVYDNAEALLNLDELKRTEERLAYLKNQIDVLTENNVRRVLYAMIDEGNSKIIALKSGGNYFSEPFQVATFPVKPASPRLALFMVMGILLGLIIAIALAILSARKN